MLSFTRLSVAVAVLAPALSAYASNILVLVGPNNQLTFSPSNITAAVGDTVTFQFQSKNHSVTQSSFASPCVPLAGGVDSGFQFVAATAKDLPEFSLTLNNASTPLFFFSAQDAVVSECQKGMVFSINANPNSAKSFAAFQAAAEESAAPSASSSAPTATASSGSEILVQVGPNNELAFSPSNVTANVGDTVVFQFLSKNHSVTQSSFASPCTPLAGGVDSGFQFVAANAADIPEFSFTISNASQPLFFFSKQTAVVNECQKGMVFSVNADPNSAKSFAAFQAAAEESAAQSAPASSGSEILVLVGENDSLTFSPSNVTANVGDTVIFQFQSKNHSVTQSSFASPCTPLAGGVDSGFQFVAANATDVPEFSFTVSDASKPLFFFSAQTAVVSECQLGMVFSVNADPNSAESFAAFQAAAEKSGASSAPASSGSEILVLVGENNSLTFSPSNISALVGDTVTFQFQSKNHSVTQSSFASPCVPLAGGVDSGFQAVTPDATEFPTFSFTLNNASVPLFFFSKQDALVSECQKGMVFSINQNPNSAKSFAAFQANAEAFVPPAANVNKKPKRMHPRDFVSAAKVARK